MTEHVVQRRGDRADREREAEAQADVDGDADNRRQRRVDALALQVAADDRADELLAEHLELAEVGLLQRVDHRARVCFERARPASLVESAAGGSASAFADGSP